MKRMNNFWGDRCPFPRYLVLQWSFRHQHFVATHAASVVWRVWQGSNCRLKDVWRSTRLYTLVETINRAI